VDPFKKPKAAFAYVGPKYVPQFKKEKYGRSDHPDGKWRNADNSEYEPAMPDKFQMNAVGHESPGGYHFKICFDPDAPQGHPLHCSEKDRVPAMHNMKTDRLLNIPPWAPRHSYTDENNPRKEDRNYEWCMSPFVYELEQAREYYSDNWDYIDQKHSKEPKKYPAARRMSINLKNVFPSENSYLYGIDLSKTGYDYTREETSHSPIATFTVLQHGAGIFSTQRTLCNFMHRNIANYPENVMLEFAERHEVEGINIDKHSGRTWYKMSDTTMLEQCLNKCYPQQKQ
jgi:hypothetical protein